MTEAWTAKSHLPGGDMSEADFEGFVESLVRGYATIDGDILYRLARAYGTRATMILGDAISVNDLGEDFGGGLFTAEIDYLIRHEFAETTEDVLYRRSKLGIHMRPEDRKRFEAWFPGRVKEIRRSQAEISA